MEQNTNKTSIF
ncbi:hypothetical protein OIU84_026663 [Salix udensis]|uniref:Uncharacterized protein n=1 Tax=Salix udensis TaxID=889485 RepID=A0AAD6KMJ8_9ROSI|nr:hypothetical protein OIU84_026663 [Salix udensis]